MLIAPPALLTPEPKMVRAPVLAISIFPKVVLVACKFETWVVRGLPEPMPVAAERIRSPPEIRPWPGAAKF